MYLSLLDNLSADCFRSCGDALLHEMENSFLSCTVTVNYGIFAPVAKKYEDLVTQLDQES